MAAKWFNSLETNSTLPLAAKPFFILKSCTAKFEVQKAFILFSISWRQTYKMATYLDRHTFLKSFPTKYHGHQAPYFIG
mgnify:CR=1 FL=1